MASVIAVAADRDALQEEALEAETLRRSDAMKTAVLRAVSHDLRTPLTAVSAAVSSLTSPNLELDESDRSELLETIRVESARLGEAGRRPARPLAAAGGAVHPRRALHPIDELVTLALDELDPDAPRVVEVAADLPPVEVDAVQITRVLVNVIENALRHIAYRRDRVGHRSAGRGERRTSCPRRGPGIPPSEESAVRAVPSWRER